MSENRKKLVDLQAILVEQGIDKTALGYVDPNDANLSKEQIEAGLAKLESPSILK